MTDEQVLRYIRDEMLSDPHVDADVVWKGFRLAEKNGDCRMLFDRWMISSPEEKTLCLRTIEDLLKIYDSND